MRLLIAGGAGFIGSMVVEEALKREHEPIVLVRPTTNLWRLKEVETITGKNVEVVSYKSVSELPSIMKDISPDAVINLVVNYVKFHKYEDISPMVSSIIDFSTHLLDAATMAEVPVFVSAGTSFEYEMEKSIIDENASLLSYDLYGALKAAFESVARYYAYTYGIRVSILRPFFVYGIRDNPNKLLIALINADRNKEFQLTPGYQELDYVYVRDVARAFIMAAERSCNKGSVYEVFNVGSGNAYSLRTVVNTLLSMLDNPPKVRWGAKDYSDKEIMYLRADITKAKNCLGWFPEYSLEDGLKEMVHYYTKEA